MINEFSVSPKAQNKKAKYLTLLLIAVSAAIVITSMAIEKYKGVVCAFALVTITAALLLYTKYLNVRYVYEIMKDADGAPLFLVRTVVGKRSTLVCRIELSSVTDVVREDKAARAAHKTPQETHRYIYCPTLSPGYTIRLYVAGYRAKSEIVIEGNEEFRELLSSYAKEARESYTSEY